MATQQAPDAGSGSGVPTCYRHAGRETYLSCTRCGRPACPECLRSAPVGQQCVECIKEGGQTARQPTAVFGGRVVSGFSAAAQPFESVTRQSYRASQVRTRV